MNTNHQAILAEYLVTLDRAPLSVNSKRGYASRATAFLEWLPDDVDLTVDGARAVRGYRQALKDAHRAPRTINATLDALGNLFVSLHLGDLGIRHEPVPQLAPRSLDNDEQRRFLRACETASVRDRALAVTLLYTGLRVAELAALNVDDVSLSAKRGRLIVWQGKGGRQRELPLNPTARDAISAYLETRRDCEAKALWLNRTGGRLSARSISTAITVIGTACGLEISPHVLRHTCATQMIRKDKIDIVLAASLLGHSRLESTRRYALPSEADRELAVDSLSFGS